MSDEKDRKPHVPLGAVAGTTSHVPFSPFEVSRQVSAPKEDSKPQPTGLPSHLFYQPGSEPEIHPIPIAPSGPYVASPPLSSTVPALFRRHRSPVIDSRRVESRPNLTRLRMEKTIDLSVLLGTVNRPALLRDAVEAIRASVADSKYTVEIVVAYGDVKEAALPWMKAQPDIVSVLGGMTGAIDAFNRAYASSVGRYICQLNDDVLVDGDSVARACEYLDETAEAAGVVFRFDRLDGLGYRLENTPYIHPNQMVARRSACERVIARIGAFWGDAAHRTHKTYGGDSAFGVICHCEGLPLHVVEGVTCRDLEYKDELRKLNTTEGTNHARAWWEMYGPLLGVPREKWAR